MRIESAFNSGVQGFQRAEQIADRASSQIARLNTPSGDQVQVTDELVNLKVAEIQAGASTKVMQTASDMMGTLIDIRV
ncbi:flagellar biosynthesis protein FlgE [Aeromonas enteropelogenes]|uniref:Flagellar biosynthesis protein FlgE n=2 Tax=Aeromonas TaxID=642 RepID=A0ABU9JE98_AEREN|nr:MULTISPECIES: flagellar hook protein FlgE [Aeromonas]MBL0458979.1 flagellar biosynthesis protein FlgE [Aeromonas enteropelogenes]MBL0522836.1 flagellar biosynthesis protein FlgE [Aeromonas enteropelogenes]MCZ0753235.1 flagellar biosynthesis protein FlgE [Aeromonas enteropelogenes]QXC35077.1 flagellar biosynthesis protein FlgE [Aeromonas sp. FDAARGOS 1407]RQM66132.1 flagellar biosynthesis protein FlgE [Aeromonas enteropelogenes]